MNFSLALESELNPLSISTRISPPHISDFSSPLSPRHRRRTRNQRLSPPSVGPLVQQCIPPRECEPGAKPRAATRSFKRGARGVVANDVIEISRTSVHVSSRFCDGILWYHTHIMHGLLIRLTRTRSVEWGTSLQCHCDLTMFDILAFDSFT